MNLVLAIIPVLLLIILMAFFKMSGDKSSVISLVVTTKIKNIHGHLKAMYKYQNNYSSETLEPGSCPRATV